MRQLCFCSLSIMILIKMPRRLKAGQLKINSQSKFWSPTMCSNFVNDLVHFHIQLIASLIKCAKIQCIQLPFIKCLLCSCHVFELYLCPHPCNKTPGRHHPLAYIQGNEAQRNHVIYPKSYSWLACFFPELYFPLQYLSTLSPPVVNDAVI